MDASQALAELTEISAQIEAAVIAERSGVVVAATIADDGRAGRFARAAADLLAAAESAGAGPGTPVQLEAALGDGSVFVVREGDRLIAAATGPDPTVGLVFYDLKSCLRNAAAAAEEPAAEAKAAEAKPKPAPRKRAPRKKKAEEGDGDGAA